MTDLLAEAACRLDRILNEAAPFPLVGASIVSRDLRHGDMVCTHALKTAAALRIPPQALAERLLSRIRPEPDFFESAEAVSGFLNFRFGLGFYLALDAFYAGLTLPAIQSALAALPFPAKPFACFSEALGIREPLPALSELRRDGGSPFYHIQYTAERYRRFMAHSVPVRSSVPASNPERALCLTLAQLPSVLVRCAEESALLPLCRYLYLLSHSARRLSPAFRHGGISPASAQSVYSVLSIFTQLFLSENQEQLRRL